MNDNDVYFLSPTATESVSNVHIGGSIGQVVIVSEDDLLKVNQSMSGCKINPKVYEYFSTYDDTNACFVPYLDVFLKYGRIKGNFCEERDYQVSRRSKDTIFYSSNFPSSKEKNVKSDVDSSEDLKLRVVQLETEDSDAEKMLLSLFDYLHTVFCSVDDDVESIESLREPFFLKLGDILFVTVFAILAIFI